MNFVLDVSVTLAWLFEDESNPATDHLLERLETESVLVPDLWLYEVANVLIAGERRNRLTETQSRRFLALLAELPIRVMEAGRSSLWADALPLAREHGLSLYDAAYLDLAMQEGLPLATRDKALGEAARRAGVELLL